MSSDGSANLLGPLFGDAEVGAYLSDRAWLQAMLEVETSLAEVEGELGVIPRQAVAAIQAAAQADRFDLSALATAAAGDGNLAISLVLQLTHAGEATHHDARHTVHWR